MLYPNPCSSKLLISGLNKNNLDLPASVIDFSGRKLLAQEISSSQNEIDVSSLPDGIYFLQLKSDDQVLVKKFEVKH